MCVYLPPSHHLLRKLIRGYGKVTAPQSALWCYTFTRAVSGCWGFVQLYLLVESSVACVLSICTPLFIVTLLLYRKVAYSCLSFPFRCTIEFYAFTCHFCFIVSWSRALLLVISVSLYYEVVYLCLSSPFRCIIKLYTFIYCCCFDVLWGWKPHLSIPLFRPA